MDSFFNDRGWKITSTSLNKFEKTVYDLITDKDFDNAFGPLATKRAGIEGTAAFKVNNLITSTEGAALVNELKSLKALSPQGSAGTGQLSEKEGERIMNFAYDPTLSPEVNLSKIDAAIAELKQNELNNTAKAKYFESKGTLQGFKSQQGQPQKVCRHPAHLH